MASVTKSHPVGFKTSSQTKNLMTHADTKDGLVPLVNSLPDSHGTVHNHLGVTGTVGKEQTVKLVSDSVEVKVPRKNSDNGITSDKRSENVGLGTKVEDSDTGSRTLLVEDISLLGRRLGDKVLLGRIPVFGCLRSRFARFVTNSKTTEGSTLVPQQAGDSPSVDTGDTGDIVSLTPLVKTLNGLVMAVLEGNIGHDNTGTLNLLRFKERDIRELSRGVGRDTIVANHRRGEDKDLTKIRGVSHRVGVLLSSSTFGALFLPRRDILTRGDTGREDSLSKLGVFTSKTGAKVALPRLEVESRRDFGRKNRGVKRVYRGSKGSLKCDWRLESRSSFSHIKSSDGGHFEKYCCVLFVLYVKGRCNVGWRGGNHKCKSVKTWSEM